jgi:hypothetical protein
VAAALGALASVSTIAARHTIGLLDPLTEDEIAEPLDDGLPQSLEAVITRYGHRWFKIKLSGDVAADLDRLGRIASVSAVRSRWRRRWAALGHVFRS